MASSQIARRNDGWQAVRSGGHQGKTEGSKVLVKRRFADLQNYAALLGSLIVAVVVVAQVCNAASG